jgi:hypothetical protein
MPVLVREQDALTAELPTVVQNLLNILGGPNVAVIGGVSKTSAVADWARGEREPKSQDQEVRLRVALRLALILKQRFGDKTVRAWFLGANHELEDESPIAVLVHGETGAVQKPLLTAARAFIQL